MATHWLICSLGTVWHLSTARGRLFLIVAIRERNSRGWRHWKQRQRGEAWRVAVTAREPGVKNARRIRDRTGFNVKPNTRLAGPSERRTARSFRDVPPLAQDLSN